MEEHNINQPTEAELEILQILWEHQPASVRLVHEKISTRREVGYTTILKQMQRMFDKKMVKREKDGKTHFYIAALKEQEVQNNFYKRMVDTVYKGSAMKLVMHALGQGDTTPEELEALQKWIEEQKKQKDDE